MNIMRRTLYTLLFLIFAFSGFAQPNLNLCITNPNGEIVSGVDNLGILVDDCYQSEIQSSTLELCGEKDNSLMNGVDILDLVFLRHIFLSGDYLTTYQFLAIDLNNSGAYDEIELVWLRMLILGSLLEFPNSTSWKFTPESEIPVSPYNGYLIDNCLKFENLPNADTSISVIGIKTGDINISNQPGIIIDTTDNIPDPLIFKTEDRVFLTNDTFLMAFTSENFDQILGYQYSISFDPNVLEFIDYPISELSNFWIFFGDDNVESGILTTLGETNSGFYIPADFSPDDTLFTITVRAKSPGILNEVLGFTSELTPKAAYDSSQMKRNVILEFEEETSKYKDLYMARVPELIIFPNPVTSLTQIRFELLQSGNTTLTLKDFSGNIVSTILDGWIEKGIHQSPIHSSNSLADGIYFIEFISGTNRVIKKLIISN